MNRVLIDTNIYTAFKTGDEEVVRAFQTFEFIGMDATVAGELLAGFAAGGKAEQNLEGFKAFLDSPRVHFIPHDYSTAEYFAQVVGQLRRKGKPIPSNDIWIAASALRYGLALYTRDGHFKSIEGILVRD